MQQECCNFHCPSTPLTRDQGVDMLGPYRPSLLSPRILARPSLAGLVRPMVQDITHGIESTDKEGITAVSGSESESTGIERHRGRE